MGAGFSAYSTSYSNPQSIRMRAIKRAPLPPHKFKLPAKVSRRWKKQKREETVSEKTGGPKCSSREEEKNNPQIENPAPFLHPDQYRFFPPAISALLFVRKKKRKLREKKKNHPFLRPAENHRKKDVKTRQVDQQTVPAVQTQRLLGGFGQSMPKGITECMGVSLEANRCCLNRPIRRH